MHACVYLCLLMNVCMRVHTHVHTRACMQCNLSRMCIHAVFNTITCAQYKLSFVPLLAPTSTDERIEKLAKTASSWIYAGAHPHSHSLSLTQFLALNPRSQSHALPGSRHLMHLGSFGHGRHRRTRQPGWRPSRISCAHPQAHGRARGRWVRRVEA